MSRRGLKLIAIGLTMLFAGFILSLYLTIPRYSPTFKSEVYVVDLRNGEVTYLFELMDFSTEHGAVWGYVIVTSSINATLHASLMYPNGTKFFMINNLTANSTKRVQLLGCIVEEAYVLPESDGTFEYHFELSHREGPSLSVLMVALMFMIVGSVLGLKGLTLVFLENGGQRSTTPKALKDLKLV